MNATAASGLRQARVRTPTLLQMEMVECGAACLGIILAHFGRIVPLPELRVACGVSRDGSKASSVLRAARAYGLEAKGYRKEIPQLAELRYPFIVFWNFNHFVVVEGAGRRGVYLNDPATGPRRVSFKEFDEAFTGVVLALHPGPSFERRGGRRGMLKGLAARVRASAGALALCCATALLLVIPGLALPALMQVFVDQVLVQRLDDWVRPVILGVLTAAVARAALAAVQARLLRRLQMKLSVSMSSRFVWHLFSLPASFYAQRYSGEIASRVGLNDGLAEKLSGPLVAAVVDSLMIGVYAVAMWQFDRTLTLIAMGMVAVNVVMLRRMARWQVDANRRLAQETGKLYGVTVSGLQAIRTIKASALESELFGRIAGHYTRTVNAQQRQTTASLYLWLVPRFVSSLMSLLILAIGGLRVMDGALTVGMLVAFQSLVASFLGPVNTLLGLDYMVQQLQADVTRLDDVLSNPTAGAPSDAAMPDGTVRLRGEVELADVRFGYNPLEPPLIDGLSLTVAPGQRIALVGGSGSGKSTVARLVAGLYAPTSGEVRFDGCPRDRLPPALLANSLAVVDQDILLFAGTIRDNLTLWDHTVPDDQIVRACRDALIHEDIVARPDGYDSLLAEGASNLSGGQRQRLDIARALVGDPAVIVLDEATSALDPETEHGIDLNLRRRGCSCIIVAHRLSTIRDADEIILLERGKVVERGTHAALMAAGGAYAALVALGDAGIETGAGVETSTGAGDAA